MSNEQPAQSTALVKIPAKLVKPLTNDIAMVSQCVRGRIKLSIPRRCGGSGSRARYTLGGDSGDSLPEAEEAHEISYFLNFPALE